MSGRAPWWRDAVVYQIYPRSFADADGDGLGDLAGVRARLDHVAWLGADAIWLNPIMPSPDADFGYDITDFCAVDPRLGTLADLDALLADAHAQRLRVLLDLVPNHTSDRHPWFLDARSGRRAARRHWYVWADPAPGGGPPNNWRSLFGGPAWTCDARTGQYFLHSFLARQPDLNWWNADVRAAFDGILRFWLDRGVDGFRIDVAAGMVKDRDLRDNPPARRRDHAVVRALGQRQRFNMDRPEVHDVLRRWRRIADGYAHEPVLLGEAYVMDPRRLAAYFGRDGDELHLAFDFPLLHAPFQPAALRRAIAATGVLEDAGAWPARAGSNHDAGRLATRWAGGDEDRARCALLLLLTLRGTPVLYYGDELALQTQAIPEDCLLDPGSDAERRGGRDGSRTPMPWAPGPGAGFTRAGARTWLPIGEHHGRTVAEQRADPQSVLHLTRRLIALRRAEPALRSGGVELLDAPPGVLRFSRAGRFEVWINLGRTARDLPGGVVAATASDAVAGGRLRPTAVAVVAT